MFGIGFANFSGHLDDYDEYFGHLKNILYDFSQEYNEELVDWCRLNCFSDSNIENKYIELKALESFIIKFENEDTADSLVMWNNIPQLMPYLEKHAPDRKKYSNLFSWKLPYPIFIFVALIMPLVLLIMIAINIYGLYKIKRIVSDKMNIESDVNLVLQSVFFSRIKLSDKEFYNLKGILIGIFFFITATFTSYLFLIAPQLAFRHVWGALYVGSLKQPVLNLSEPFNNIPDHIGNITLIIPLIYLIISIIIGIQYIRLMKK